MNGIRVKIEADVLWHPYKTKKQNERAKRQVLKQIRELLRDNCCFLSIEAEKETRQIRWKVTGNK